MATRREALTAAAHKVLLSNPGLYRDITNVQALRREQVSRAAQRLLTLNDPGAGAVERAFQDAGEMSEQLPKLLKTKADLMDGLQKTVQEALKSKTALDEGAVRIIVAGIGAEGQAKAAYNNAFSDMSVANSKARIDAGLAQGSLVREMLTSYGAKQTPDEVAKTAEALNSFRAATAGGGTSQSVDTRKFLGGLSPQQALQMMATAANTNDSELISNLQAGLDEAGKLDAAVGLLREYAAADKDFSGRLDVLSTETLLSGPEGTTQADRQVQGLRTGLFVMSPKKAEDLKRSREILSDPAQVEILNKQIAGEVPPDMRKALDQIDDAIDKASRSRDLASPTEVREAIRTSEGVVQTAREELDKAGIEDDGRLMGLGAAVRRATRQQQRGLVKEIGEDKEVKTRRLSMIKEQALARKNKANWAEKPLTEDEADDRKGDAVKSANDASPNKKANTPLDFSLDGLPEDAPDPEEKTAPGVAPGQPPATEQTRKAAREARDTAIASATASRRREGVLDSLRKYLPKQAPAPAEEEEEQDAFATPGPKKRPPGSRFTTLV
jgi:hypothetical protein